MAGNSIETRAPVFFQFFRKSARTVIGREPKSIRHCLFPTTRDVHRHLVRHLVRLEQALLAGGRLERPLSDAALAEWVRVQYRQPMSRRAVAYIRQQFGVPRHRARMTDGGYLAAASGFSLPRS